MTRILFDSIPSLDLADFTSGSPGQKQQFVHDLGSAYSNIGFVSIRNHGLTEELTTKLYNSFQAFFNLPDVVKATYEDPLIAGQRGYVGKGREHAKGRTIGDLKEYYHIGQEVYDDDPIKEEYPSNIWPHEISGFKQVSLQAYRVLEDTGKQVLRAIALYLELEENYFDDKIHHGNSILRPIHYFPIENPSSLPEGAVRAAEHGDINLITLLMGASADGLQVLRHDGKWIPITALPDHLVVNVGDMLERLTNDRMKSTIHRVVNPPMKYMGMSRYSIPFFMHPRSEMDLSCLANCINPTHPKKYADTTAGAFLDERLIELGLKTS